MYWEKQQRIAVLTELLTQALGFEILQLSLDASIKRTHKFERYKMTC